MAALVLPGNYPYYLDLIHSLSVGPFLVGLAKFGIALPLSYHTFNGVRHLVRFNLILRHGKHLLFYLNLLGVICRVLNLKKKPDLDFCHVCFTDFSRKLYITFAQLYKVMVLLILSGLLSLFFVFVYHYLNQLWDTGKGFKLPEVYRSGYTVIGLSVITTVLLVLL